MLLAQLTYNGNTIYVTDIGGGVEYLNNFYNPWILDSSEIEINATPEVKVELGAFNLDTKKVRSLQNVLEFEVTVYYTPNRNLNPLVLIFQGVAVVVTRDLEKLGLKLKEIEPLYDILTKAPDLEIAFGKYKGVYINNTPIVVTGEVHTVYRENTAKPFTFLTEHFPITAGSFTISGLTVDKYDINSITGQVTILPYTLNANYTLAYSYAKYKDLDVVYYPNSDNYYQNTCGNSINTAEIPNGNWTALDPDSYYTENRHYPLLLGSISTLSSINDALHLPAFPVNEYDLVYHGNYSSVTQVYDDGISVSATTNSDGTFVLDNSPVGEITFLANGNIFDFGNGFNSTNIQGIIYPTEVRYFVQPTQPLESNTKLSLGYIWIDTSDLNKQYVWNGVQWALVSDRTMEFDLSTAMSKVTDLEATRDGTIQVFYQTSEPSTGDYGDYWVDLDNQTWIVNAGAGQTNIYIVSRYENTEGGSTAPLVWRENRGETALAISYAFVGKKTAETAQTTFENWVADTYESDIGYLQNQVDGVYVSWFGEDTPTLLNSPANQWTTDAIKNEHLGDKYYDTNDGKAYRFSFSSGVYVWTEIQDTGVAQALLNAYNAQITADGKVQTFTGVRQTQAPTDQTKLWLFQIGAAGDNIGGNLQKYDSGTSSWVSISNILGQGDLFFSQNEYNKMFRYNDSIDRWESARDTSLDTNVATSLLKLNDLDKRAGDTKIFYDTTEPENLPAGTITYGDFWLNPNTTWNVGNEALHEVRMWAGNSIDFPDSNSSNAWQLYKGETALAIAKGYKADKYAGEAFGLADKKKVIFHTTPTVPYDVGDLWVAGSAGDIKVCTTARSSGSYTNTDWVLASKYTDDTQALVAKQLAQESTTILTNIASDSKVTPQEKPAITTLWNSVWTEVFDIYNEAKRLQLNYEATVYMGSATSLGAYLQTGIGTQIAGINILNLSFVYYAHLAHLPLPSYTSPTINGVSMPSNIPFLLAGQVDSRQNGVYIWDPNSGVVRSPDFQIGSSYLRRAFVPTLGMYAGNTFFINPQPSSITLGTTNLPFSYINGVALTATTLNGSTQFAPNVTFDISQSNILSSFAAYNNAKIQAVSKFSAKVQEIANSAVYALSLDLDDLQSQLDRSIISWFGITTPTLLNSPANQWTTDAIKNDHLGDLYYDEAAFTGYRFVVANGVYSWVVETNSDIVNALSTASKTEAALDGKITTYSVTRSSLPPSNTSVIWLNYTGFLQKIISGNWTPIATVEGDLAIVTNDNNKLYRRNATGIFTVIRDTTNDANLATALSKVEDLKALIDGEIECFYQENTPSPASYGDFWVKTSTKAVYRYEGTDRSDTPPLSWVLNTSAIAEAYKSVANTQAAVDGKISAFYVSGTTWYNQITAKVGDLLYRIDQYNMCYKANIDTPSSETHWTSVRDTTIDTKMTTFLQTGIPISKVKGDTWINSSNKKRYIAVSSGADEIKAGEWEFVGGDEFDEKGNLLKALNASFMPDITPNSAGLYMDNKQLGYYDGSKWTAALKATGDFYLGSENTENFLGWDGEALNIKGNFLGVTAGRKYHRHYTDYIADNIDTDTATSKYTWGIPVASANHTSETFIRAKDTRLLLDIISVNQRYMPGRLFSVIGYFSHARTFSDNDYGFQYTIKLYKEPTYNSTADKIVSTGQIYTVAELTAGVENVFLMYDNNNLQRILPPIYFRTSSVDQYRVYFQLGLPTYLRIDPYDYNASGIYISFEVSCNGTILEIFPATPLDAWISSYRLIQ